MVKCSSDSGENMKDKKMLGQFFTITNPFEVEPFKLWMNTIDIDDNTIFLEPFAGANNIVNMISYNTLNNLDGIFFECSDIIEIEIHEMDITNVQIIGNMFKGCTSLVSVKFPNWDTSSITNMGTMFQDCSSLASVDLSHFLTTSLSFIDNLFIGCSSF